MPEHILARGALPPDFSAVDIDCHSDWDGGLVSNTPLQFVMGNLGSEQVCIFQVDVFSAQGRQPENLADVAQREKNSRFSSRTCLITDHYRLFNHIPATAEWLKIRLL